MVFIKGTCVFHYGMANDKADPAASSTGSICQQAMDKEKGNYLANLGLYPGKSMTLAFPESLQTLELPQTGQASRQAPCTGLLCKLSQDVECCAPQETQIIPL